MKLIYVVIDGMGDLPTPQFGGKTPLEAADTPNLDSLAKSGQNGLMYTVARGIAPESDVGVISILGYDPFKYSTGRGVLEAIGAGMRFRNGNVALRCNFATLGNGDRITDRRAGRDLETQEATELARSIRNRVKLQSLPADFDFESTVGYRAALVIRSRSEMLSAKITNTDPAYSKVEGIGVAKPLAEGRLQKCEPMEDTPEARTSAKLVNEFVQKSHEILDSHDVNLKRTAAGKQKANVILTRDAGSALPTFFNINEKYGVQFVSLADMPVERGISKLTGMAALNLPPPSGNLESDCRLRVRRLLDAISKYDCFYVHIKGADEPGHDGDFQLKTRLISVIDRFFFGEFFQKARIADYIFCVTADHATPCMLKGHSDDPVPLLISGGSTKGDNLVKFSEKECRKGSLGVLPRGSELMPKLMRLLKERRSIR